MVSFVLAGCAAPEPDAGEAQSAIGDAPVAELFAALAAAPASEFTPASFSYGTARTFVWTHSGKTMTVGEAITYTPNADGSVLTPTRGTTTLQGVARASGEGYEAFMTWNGASVMKRFERAVLEDYKAAALDAFTFDDGDASRNACERFHRSVFPGIDHEAARFTWRTARGDFFVCDFSGGAPDEILRSMGVVHAASGLWVGLNKFRDREIELAQ